MPEAVPQRLKPTEKRRVLTLMSDRQTISNTNYVPGLGSEDQEGPIRTIPRSYTEGGLTEGDEADIYNAGGASGRARFLDEQQEMQATQEQFLPGSTGALEAPFSPGELPRQQQVRPSGQEGGPSEADIAAELDRQRQAQAMNILRSKMDEEEDASGQEEGMLKKAESARRTFSRLMDLFDAATIEDVMGGIMLIVNTNMRLLTMRFKKNSLTRKIFPAAQFPFEAAAIVSFDMLLIPLFLGALTVMLAPMIIFMVVIGGGGTAILAVINRLGG